MPRVGIMRAGPASSLCLILSMLAGCSDKGRDHEPTAAYASVHEESSRTPVAGVRLVLMEEATNTPVAMGVSDAMGRVGFPGLSFSDYRLVAFGGNAFRIYGLPQNWHWYGKSHSRRVPEVGFPTAPPAARTPPAPIPPVVLVQANPGDALPRIAGTVKDAVTGLPLDLAFVGLSPYLEGYHGGTGPEDDVTGPDGLFAVHRIPFARDPVSGNLIQIAPLRITRHGYRPVVWAYDPPNGSEDLDIRGVSISLEPLASGDTGILRGRLLLGGLPAAGVRIGLGKAGFSGGNKDGVGMTGWSAVTDSAGIYAIKGLPAGDYLLHPGYLLYDGTFYPNQGGNTPRRVEPDQTTEAGDLFLVHEIEPYYPPNGILLGEPLRELAWSAVPGASRYQAYLDGGLLPSSSEPRLVLPDSLIPLPGLHRWGVSAFDAEGAPLGTVQVDAGFRVREAAP